MNKSRFSGWQKVLLIIIPFFIMVLVFQTIASSVLGEDAAVIEESGSTLQKLGVHIFVGAAYILVVWLFMKYIDKESFVNVGLQIENRSKDLIWGFSSGFLIMGVGFLILWGIGEVKFLGFNVDVLSMMALIAIFIVVSFAEEILFRGYILRNLMQSFNKYIALLVSSASFALLHSFSPGADFFSTASIFLAGAMLGLSYIYTKNLWFPIGLHLGWNLFESLFGFNVSGKSYYSLFELEIGAPSLLNGGSFGFEVTILAIIAEVVMIFLIWNHFSKQSTH